MLESKLHQNVSFLTLTYHNDYLPPAHAHHLTGEIFEPNSVTYDHHKKFVDNLRQNFRLATCQTLRYYMCAEYGMINDRPHYHYILFGVPPCPSPNNFYQRKGITCPCAICQLIFKSWKKGSILLAPSTPATMAYVCGYVTKKLNNNTSEWQISRLMGRSPEFSKSSKKPGIGRDYIKLVANTLLNMGIDRWQDIPQTLNHGPKSWPLGAYLRNHLISDMGFTLKPEEKLNELKTQLQDMLADAPSTTVNPLALKRNLAIALKQYNQQKVLNLEAKEKLYSKNPTLIDHDQPLHQRKQKL